MDPSLIARIGGVESGFRNVPNAAEASSATGPFQVTEGTWNGLRTRYRDLALGDRTNPYEQAKAIPYLVRENRDYLSRELKRDPTDGETYLAHFLGAEGASKALRADPSTPISAVISPAAIAANPKVFGSMSSVSDLVAWGDKKMGGGTSPLSGTVKYGQGPQFPQGKADIGQAQAPSPYTYQEISAQEKERAASAFSLTQGAVEAFKQESTIRWAFENAGRTAPDPSFIVTADLLKEVAPTAKPEHIPYLRDSFSREDLDDRVQRLKRDIEVEQKLDAMGLAKSLPLRLAAATLDPGGWLLTAALAPVGGAYKLGRLGKVVGGAAMGAVGNLVSEVPMAMNKPTWERDQLLYAAAGGALFGSVFGRSAFDNPAIADDVKALQVSSRSMMAMIEQRYPEMGDSAGAMRNPFNRESVRGDVSDFLTETFANSDVAQQGALSGVRFDITGRLKASENPLVRALGNLLGEETVGQADKTRPTMRAITEDQQILQRRYDTAWGSAYRSQWDDYRERHGLGWAAGVNGEETRFRQSVTAAMRSTDPTEEFDPAVKQLAGTWREINKQWLSIAKGDHRSLDGTMRAPMRGFENVDPSDHYVPRLVQWDRWRQLHDEFGTRNMEALLRRAIVGRNPDIDLDLAERMARGYVRRLAHVDAGQELSASRAFSSGDIENMKLNLRETDLSEEEIEKVLYEAVTKDQGKAAISRGKPRTLLDENFRLELTGKNGTREVRIADLFHDDAMMLVSSYNRQMAGATAMSRLRIENPNWRPGEDDIHPRYLVDGVQGAGEWDTLIKKVRAVASDLSAGPAARESVEADVRRLQFMYDGIMGVPSAFDRTKSAAYLRMFRDYNFIRVMNQVGFAQVAEVGMITGGLGLKTAISSMPSLRSFFRDARTGALRDEDARALEWISTGGTDYIRGIGHVTTDDFGSPVTHVGSPGMARAEALLTRGTQITSQISGMTAINTYLQRWASRGVLYKFLDMSAEGARVNRQRLRVLGLSDDMQERIFAEIRAKKGTVQGEEKGSKIKTLGLEQWDPEVRGAFEHAIFRWTRKIIQENDLGQTNTILGHSIGKLLMQFRSFMIGAWTKNTLHNAYMRDWETMSMILGTMTFGGLAYAAQAHLQSIGRSDREKFLEKKLNPQALIAGAFQRAGFSSVFPGAIDNGAWLVGMDPLFDSRVTGQPSQGLTSFAGASLIDNAMGGVRGVVGAARGTDPFSQRDAKSLVGTLPFSNTFPLLWLSNAMASGLPERDPKPTRH